VKAAAGKTVNRRGHALLLKLKVEEMAATNIATEIVPGVLFIAIPFLYQMRSSWNGYTAVNAPVVASLRMTYILLSRSVAFGNYFSLSFHW
jgi:hypothetical protein